MADRSCHIAFEGSERTICGRAGKLVRPDAFGDAVMGSLATRIFGKAKQWPCPDCLRALGRRAFRDEQHPILDPRAAVAALAREVA